jgi:DNA-binding SARP family transcriptional activator/predicted ATPase
MRVQLLGSLRFTCGQHLLTSITTNRLQSLLAFLLLNGQSPQSREHVAAILWPESSDAQARTNLRQLIHHLRRAIPAECSLLAIDNHTVQWRPEAACSIDVFEFETAVRRAAEAGGNGDARAARDALEEAVRLYEDDLLPGVYDDWLNPRREQLRRQHVDVLSRLAALLEMTGDPVAGIRHATRLVAVDPLREPSYQLLMRLHARNNDRSSALRVYHQCMRTLKRELGISPAPATQTLFNEVLQSKHPPDAVAEAHPYAAAKPLAFIGRTTEWEGLRECWRRVTEGEPHFALIKGEPGVGKSRLADELFRFCSEYPHAAVARARCYFAQGRVAYGPVTEWLRAGQMQVARAQLPGSQLAELTRVLPEILIERPHIAPPPPLTESWQRRHFYEALSAGFGTSPKPLLLLVDDLQWCDHDSFDWLHSFFRSEASVRTLVVGTVRPEDVRRDHPLNGFVSELRRNDRFSEFPLQRLGVAESAALAVQVARGPCEAGFLNELYQTTGGNPLFVVESVRASLEDPMPGNSIPARVQAVISARLAQLSPAAYELAGLAATIGRSFSFDLLARATDWDEESVSRALEEVWERRIIDVRSEPAIKDTYDFTHDLLREVAYSEVSPMRRRSLHRRVARALEELHADDFTSVNAPLAAHYEAAGMAEKAIQCFLAAASTARQRFADTEAADLIRRALRVCRAFPESVRRDREEIELLVNLGPSLVTTYGYSMPEVGETYERGLLLSRRSGDRKRWFSLLSGAWFFNIVRGQLGHARRLADECVAEARREGTQTIEMAGRFLLGSSLFHLGHITESMQEIQQSVLAGRGPCDPGLSLFAGPDLGVFCRAYLSHVLWYLGDAAQAAAHSNESITLARELSHPFTLAIALDYAAMLNAFRNQGQVVLALAVEASAISVKYGFAYYSAWAEMLAGWGIGVEGDPAAGLARFRHGLDALRATGAELRLPFYYGLLAELCGLAGHAGDALANVASAFAFQSKNGELWCAPELHRIHGDVLLRSGAVAGAELSYHRAMESARQVGAPLLEQRAAARLRDQPGFRADARRAGER